MSDSASTPPVIDTSVAGYLKPIATALVTRGLLAAVAFLSAKGIHAPDPTSAQIAAVVAGLGELGLWVWGGIKAYFDHKVKGQLQAAPAVKT